MADIKKIRLSGTTYNIVDENALHTLDANVTSGGTNAVQGSGIYNAITASSQAVLETVSEAGYQTASDVEAAVSGKADTSAVTESLNAKADTSALTAVDNVLTAHTANTDIHVTSADKTAWNAKVDASDLNGYADAVKYNSTSKYVEFYHGGTGGTKVFEYDASPFIIDGMVQNVEIKDVTISGQSVTCLVVSFNTDAGKQDINIPISEIFDASNYYTTAQTDSAIASAVSGKADSSVVSALTSRVGEDEEVTARALNELEDSKQDVLTAGSGIQITSGNVISVTGVPLTVEDYVTSGSSNPVKSSGIYTAVAAKQDTLVSGTNIKTVGTNSLLGSGNIALMTAHLGTGNDSETLIFDFA